MSPSSSESDRALVLRRHPYSESSLIASVLTRRHGVQRILARVAKGCMAEIMCKTDGLHKRFIQA